jgi:hypothetical protein
MEYIDVARQAICRYEQRRQETKQILLLYKELLNNGSSYELQLKQAEISHTKNLKLAQETLAMLEQSLQIKPE